MLSVRVGVGKERSKPRELGEMRVRARMQELDPGIGECGVTGVDEVAVGNVIVGDEEG